MMKQVVWLVTIVLCFQLNLFNSAQSARGDSIRVKELNFVFLHGAGGSACDLQLLADSLMERIPPYITIYEQANPGTKIQVDTLKRCYPNDVDIDTWGNNIAASIGRYFQDKKNLILIGHSMGGKAALYAVTRDIGGLSNKVAAVVTINSPIKDLSKYYISGGGSVSEYCRARWLLSDRGICGSIAYDSSQDGSWVGANKYWLAFISGEGAPLSKQFDVGGVDTWPRDMDDGIIPVSAQYSDGADVVYYGEYSHSDFKILEEVAGIMADQILSYLFGRAIECSVFARGGTLEHTADWLLGTDYWEDVVGGVLASSGSLRHWNESYTRSQEWEDIVGWCPFEDRRDSYQVTRVRGSSFFTSIEELRWLNPDNPEDCQLYLRTSAAPRSYIQVDWYVYRQGLLPMGVERDRYEVEIVTGTPFADIRYVSWATKNHRDLRLRIQSEAESPFRWFKAEWRVYYKESRQRNVIDQIP